jgi:transcriptional regulator with XRE-family HTH domain
MTMDTEPIATTVGRRLRETREHLGLTRKDAAERLSTVRARKGQDGLSHVAIGHYETGYRAPSLETLLELAQAYEVAATDLLPRPQGDHGKGPATDITVRVRGYYSQADLEDALVATATGLGAEAYVVQSSIPYAIPEGS